MSVQVQAQKLDLNVLGAIFSERNVLIVARDAASIAFRYPRDPFLTKSVPEKEAERNAIRRQMAEVLALDFQRVKHIVTEYEKTNPLDAERLENNIAIAVRAVKSQINYLNKTHEDATSYANLWLHYRGASAIERVSIAGQGIPLLVGCAPIPPSEIHDSEIGFRKTELVEFEQKLFDSEDYRFLKIEFEDGIYPVEIGAAWLVNGPASAFQIAGHTVSNLIYDYTSNLVYYKPEGYDHFIATDEPFEYAFNKDGFAYSGVLNMDKLHGYVVDMTIHLSEAKSNTDEFHPVIDETPVIGSSMLTLPGDSLLINKNGLLLPIEVPYIYLIYGPESGFKAGNNVFSHFFMAFDVLERKDILIYPDPAGGYFTMVDEVELNQETFDHDPGITMFHPEDLLNANVVNSFWDHENFVRNISSRSGSLGLSESTIDTIRDNVPSAIRFSFVAEPTVIGDVIYLPVNSRYETNQDIERAVVRAILSYAGGYDQNNTLPGAYDSLVEYLHQTLVSPLVSNFPRDNTIFQLSLVVGHDTLMRAIFDPNFDFVDAVNNLSSDNWQALPNIFYRTAYFTSDRAEIADLTIPDFPIRLFFAARDAGLSTENLLIWLRNADQIDLSEYSALQYDAGFRLYDIFRNEAYDYAPGTSIHDVRLVEELFQKELALIPLLDSNDPKQAFAGGLILDNLSKTYIDRIMASDVVSVEQRSSVITAAAHIIEAYKSYFQVPSDLPFTYGEQTADTARIGEGGATLTLEVHGANLSNSVQVSPDKTLNTRIIFGSDAEAKMITITVENYMCTVDGFEAYSSISNP